MKMTTQHKRTHKFNMNNKVSYQLEFVFSLMCVGIALQNDYHASIKQLKCCDIDTRQCHRNKIMLWVTVACVPVCVGDRSTGARV